MSNGLKSERLDLRLTRAQKEAISEAAALEGRSITDFSTAALTARADEVIRRDREMRLDSARFDAFTRFLDEPARSIDGLRDLLTRKPVFRD